MFKKGQLVKTINGTTGVVEKESTVFMGYYLVRFKGGYGLSTAGYYRPNELKLIDNNFKFKGAS